MIDIFITDLSIDDKEEYYDFFDNFNTKFSKDNLICICCCSKSDINKLEDKIKEINKSELYNNCYIGCIVLYKIECIDYNNLVKVFSICNKNNIPSLYINECPITKIDDDNDDYDEIIEEYDYPKIELKESFIMENIYLNTSSNFSHYFVLLNFLQQIKFENLYYKGIFDIEEINALIRLLEKPNFIETLVFNGESEIDNCIFNLDYKDYEVYFSRLCNILETNTTITTLKIDDCYIFLKYILQHSSKDSKLHKLYTNYLTRICDSLCKNTTITSLSLPNECLKESIKSVEKLLRCNETITQLHIYFSDEEILSNHFDVISESLKQNTSLTSLTLSSTSDSEQLDKNYKYHIEKFGKSLISYLKNNKTLTSLQLDFKIQNDELTYLNESYENFSLTFIDIMNASFEEILRTNTTLTSLEYFGPTSDYDYAFLYSFPYKKDY